MTLLYFANKLSLDFIWSQCLTACLDIMLSHPPHPTPKIQEKGFFNSTESFAPTLWVNNKIL